MLEARRTRDIRVERSDTPVPSVIFDYFASEILSHSDSDTERVLLSTSMLEEISPELAVALSGVADAAARLDRLSNRGYFTARHEGATPIWTHHQLFRKFLRRQAESQLGVEAWSELQSRAARELASTGNVEQAIELCRRVRDWEGIVPLLSSYAPLLLAQGRHRSVLRWLDDVPADLLERSPWLLYWGSLAQMLLDPSLAREGFARAFRAFQADRDTRGTFLAWAMSVQNIFYEQSDYRSFDEKIEELEPLLQRFDLPDESVEAVVYTSLALCVLWHSLDHPSRDSWIERALELEGRLPDSDSRIQFLALAHSAFIFAGETSRSKRVLNALHGLAEALPRSSPASSVFRAVQGLDLWVRGEFEASLAAVEEGLAAAETSGTSVMVPLTLSDGAACASSLEDHELIEHYLGRMEEATAPHRRLDYSFVQLGRSWQASLDGNWPSAYHWIERAGITLEPLGVPAYSALADIFHGVARHYLGDWNGARASIALARERVGARGRFLVFGAAMAEAEVALDRGDDSAARRALSEALALGRECGFWNFLGWRRDALSRLCAEALAAGIEAPYVQSLIEKHHLLPPERSSSHLDHWPWPVAVRFLGGFELVRDGQPVRFRGKVPRKPLQLLELLAIRGGDQVPEDWLADALWPDADGDAAGHALSSTILRLRRLLELDGLVVRRNRCVTLDRRRCWVDAWELEDALGALPGLEDADAIASAADRVIRLCRGPFVPQSSLAATLDYRDSLLQRALARLGRAAERVADAGESERARAIREGVVELRARVARTD